MPASISFRRGRAVAKGEGGKGVTVITHPLVQHNLTRLRDLRMQSREFRRVLSEVAGLLLYEATHAFVVRPSSVKTPLASARGFRLRREVLLVPGLGDAGDRLFGV